MNAFFNKVRMFVSDEEGATAIEYGLIATLIAIAIIAGATALGTQLNTRFCEVVAALGGGCE